MEIGVVVPQGSTGDLQGSADSDKPLELLAADAAAAGCKLHVSA